MIFRYITWFEIGALVAALIALPLLWQVRAMRFLLALLVLTVGVEFYQALLVFGEKSQNNSALYNFLAPVQWLLYGLMLLYSLSLKRNRLLMKILLSAFGLVQLGTIPHYLSVNQYNVVGHAAGTVVVVVGILLTFYEMLKSPQGFNFLRQPYFYILFALLLFTVGTSPYFIMGNWLHFNMGRQDLVVVLANVMSILNYVLYTTYAVVFLWIRVRKGFY